MEIVEKEKWQFRRSVGNASGCLLSGGARAAGRDHGAVCVPGEVGRAGAERGAQLPPLLLCPCQKGSEGSGGRAGSPLGSGIP